MNAAVFLDRDNTLIHNDGDLGEPDQVRLIQGAASAVASLCGLGYKVVVVSNQGGVARGHFTEKDVEAVNERIRDLVRTHCTGADIDRFYYCPYHPEGTVKRYQRDHPWRKPHPGMLQQAADDLDLDLSQSWMIGDQMRDVQAGAAAGVRTILLSNGRPGPSGGSNGAATATPDFIAASLVEAVRIVAQQRKREATDPPTPAAAAQTERWKAVAATAIRNPQPRQTNGTAATATLEPTTTASPGPVAPAGKPADKSRPATRPFRPWNAPEPKSDEPSSTTATASPATSTPAAQPSSEPQAAAQTPTASTEPSPVEPPAVETTLRQILQELRNQRSAVSEFSYLSVLAVVLQMVALVCLLAALLLGRTDEAVFFRWIGAGLLVQLATIATLLFGR